MLTREQFLKHLRDALNHLYDPNYLRQSPLVAMFGKADRFDAPAYIKTVLIKAIESLNIEADEPTHLRHNKQIYELLSYRYVEQFSQKEVADQLGISVRHLRREQYAALEVLAYRLWEEFHLETKIGQQAEAETELAQSTATNAAVNDELAWLKNVPLENNADLSQTLPVVLDLVRPLAKQHQVHLEVTLANDLPNLVMHLVALRQILLNLLTVAINQSPGGQVTIQVRPLRWEVEIQIQGQPSSARAWSLSNQERTGLEVAQKMTDLSGGKLIVSADEPLFKATVNLPAVEQMPVLVIDDNADTLQLLQRYTTGSRYRLVCTQDPKQALTLVEQLHPQLIVLDVMMPQVDGWELLSWLRQHPAAEHVPIIVCTILAQEELAFSLGADAFISKPIQRQAFLAALDHQIEAMATTPR